MNDVIPLAISHLDFFTSHSERSLLETFKVNFLDFFL